MPETDSDTKEIIVQSVYIDICEFFNQLNKSMLLDKVGPKHAVLHTHINNHTLTRRYITEKAN